jgi:RNA polymerase sigma factor (sigma-70 family)
MQEVAQLPPHTERSSDAEVYEALAPELIRFATGLVGKADASDVLSSAVVKALGAPAWPSVGDQRAYLYRAVFHEACTWRRRAAQRPERERRASVTDRWEMPAFRPDVGAAVARLSVKQRAVILLTYWADLRPADVADRLGVSEGSVRRHLARARAHLREVLDA